MKKIATLLVLATLAVGSAGAQDTTKTATTATDTVAQRPNFDTTDLYSPDVTLQDLEAYVVGYNKADRDKRVVQIYRNLVNLPTHSCRFTTYYRMGINGFKGYVGTVTETVVDNDGTSTTLTYHFNKQGLLDKVTDSAAKSTITYQYDYDPAVGFKIVSKKVGNKTYTYSTTTTDGRLVRLDCTDGTSQTFNYNDKGYLRGSTLEEKGHTPEVIKYINKGSGPIVRSFTQGKKVHEYHYGDGNVVPATDITSVEVKEGQKVLRTWTYEYRYDDQDRWTRCLAKVNGKPRFTLTRTYGE